MDMCTKNINTNLPIHISTFIFLVNYHGKTYNVICHCLGFNNLRSIKGIYLSDDPRNGYYLLRDINLITNFNPHYITPQRFGANSRIYFLLFFNIIFTGLLFTSFLERIIIENYKKYCVNWI